MTGNIVDSAGHDAAWYRERTDFLADFMTDDRADTLRRVLADRTRYATVCLENMFHPQNASALVRTCEAFGLQEMHAIEEKCRFLPNLPIVRGTDKWVDLHTHPSTGEAIRSLRRSGYRIVATTPHHGDTPPEEFDVEQGPFAVVFGTEHAGISEEMLQAADAFIRIPMCGFVESLNVSASASIILYELTTRLRRSGVAWQLEESDREQTLYRWMVRSVRDARRILATRFPEE